MNDRKGRAMHKYVGYEGTCLDCNLPPDAPCHAPAVKNIIEIADATPVAVTVLTTPVRAFLLEWIDDETDEPDPCHTAIVLAATDKEAESAIYQHHLDSNAYLRGTVRHWLWREIDILHGTSAVTANAAQLLKQRVPYDVTAPTHATMPPTKHKRDIE